MPERPTHESTRGVVMLSSRQLPSELRWFKGAEPADAVTLAYLATGGADRTDPDRLAAALTALAARHPALRGPRPPQGVTVHATPGEGWDAVGRALAAAESRAGRPFDLGDGPLLRAELYRWTQGALLVVQVHRSAVDGPSLPLLEAELERLYGAGPEAGPLPAPVPDGLPGTLPAAAPDPDGADALRAAWAVQLAGAVPQARPVAAAGAAASGPAQLRLSLARPVLDGLLVRAGDATVTPALALLAVYGLALARFTGQRDLCVGLPVPARHEPGRWAVIGPLADLVPVRVRTDGADAVADFRSVLGSAAFALRHQRLGYEEIRACGPAAPGPLLRTVFSDWPRCASRTLDLDGAVFAPARLTARTSPFDLTAETVDPGHADGRLYLDLTADPDVLDGGALRALGDVLGRTAHELAGLDTPAQEVP
ncbi:condensation domain-containing protein [Streptomyces sp. NPDC006512]|uniref:condensation domain-containing protein n=1 Tax=Streptomyces sp. NPDC006512 TaxID=3154307 RepID=UPI0033B76A6C